MQRKHVPNTLVVRFLVLMAGFKHGRLMQFIVITKKSVWRVKAKSVQFLTRVLHDLNIEFLSVTEVE